ncbi:GTPase IMAP family member 7-like [Thunnus maccoyii]|uniref:GTPase IMAP family member 7-like n=1 Tax=Thunnus maccoyii TaxID=8240 RepID=UPI001C4BDDC4|nr:GTPase IMAP family member 7-like [Thunnus maccoyii]
MGGRESSIGATEVQTPTTSEQPADSDRRIVLLGKTGAGKSSLANTIFREDVFEINHTANAGTSQCANGTRSVNEKSITLIDTPGFFDPDKSKKELKDEIVKCIIECAPGPHVFLILLKVEKFTNHEKQVIDKIRRTFSEEAFKYAAVVFTHGDQLRKGQKIEEFVQDNKVLSDVVKKCGDRCHVIDNKYWKNNQQDEYRSNQFQVAELLKTIDKIVEENKGGCYTNEMLRTVYKLIKKYGKIYVSNFLKKSVGITTGVLLGALLGVPVMIVSVVRALMKMRPSPAAEAAEVAVGAAVMPTLGVAAGVEAAVAAAAGAAAGPGLGIAAGVAAGAGALVGGFIGYREADKAASVGEAAKNTAKFMLDKSLHRVTNQNQQQSEDNYELLTDQ